MPTIEKVFPEYIRLDGGTQPRAKIDQAVCDDYGERMKAGETFPPIDIFFDGENYWLADGFHRIQAYVMAVPGEAIECNVFQGTQQDAQWHSYSVNRTHGLRRTNEDKLRATRAALLHSKSKGYSDAMLADYVGVHRQTVQKLRHELEATKRDDLSMIDKSTPRRGRDGRSIRTSSIGEHGANKAKRKVGKRGIRISPDAAMPVLGHSLPNPMISLSLPPNNPVIAAATIFKLFNTDFVRTLVAELTQRLQGIDQ